MNLFKVQGPSAFAKATADKSSKVPGSGRTPRATLGFRLRPSNFGDRDGVALVITLIMLSIITFMAVTFLVLSQRERSSVSTAMDQKTARNASDAGLARVSAELLTGIMFHTNFQELDLMVSTNYINLHGLHGGVPGNLSPTNVNYEYLDDGTPIVNSQDRNINIASLYFNARPPVYVVTNVGTGQSDFRYYYDMNRNGRFDKNGNWPVVVNDPVSGLPRYINATNGALVSTNPPLGIPVLTNSFVGDPEWIGVLERPAELHSADNHFIARYAYIVMPIGKTLDVNYIHNRAKRPPGNPTGEGFLRNQGVGTWEINLAAFLADLNTNAWWNPIFPGPVARYSYNQNNLSFSTGAAFTNANDFLNYRYGNTPIGYQTLYPANAVLAGPATLAATLASYNIDLYSDGPLMLTVNTNENIPSGDAPGNSWSGSENTNHFFSSQDVFSQMPPGFRTVLSNLGTSNDSYNAYTFYRMLAQLGSDSAPDEGKINVNFKNTDLRGNIVPGMETNLTAWTALDFFTNAATAMFRQMNLRDFNGNLVTVTNIPVYEDPVISGFTNHNYYTPAVHRVLQMAANMYDATTNRFFNGVGPTNYPSVFRPFFRSQGGVVSIAGYVEVTELTTADAFLPILEPQTFATVDQLNKVVNMYGVPWVIGAKKGLPNFNEFSMENALQVTRKLEFTNNVAGKTTPPWQTNQIFDFAITNTFGIEAWNSYTNGYGRSLRLVVSNEVTITLTNETGFSLLTVSNLPFGNDISFSGWSRWSGQLTDNSFLVPLQARVQFTNGIYGKTFVKPLNPPVWSAAFVPRLWLTLQNKIRYVLIDNAANRVIDFVNIVKTEPAIDVGLTLMNGFNGKYPDIDHVDAMWDLRLKNGIQAGILNQIEVSYDGATATVWTDKDKIARSDIFRRNIDGNSGTNRFQAPYAPPRTIYQRVSLEANDPLVHYTYSDLTSTNGSAQVFYNIVELNAKNPPLATISNLNFSYQPWGGRHTPGNQDLNQNQFRYDWRVKDPMVEQSDNWDFPTNKLPNIGWFGRIHRGTPWQTVYLKSSDIAPDDWTKWSNDNIILTNGNDLTVDSQMTQPRDDYRLFDLFTTAINDNASRGQLSVNQTNLAAWSAVLSGVNVLSNSPTGLQGLVVSPAGVYDTNAPTPVAAIVQSINAARANTNSAKGALLVFANQVFQHAGDVLAAPQLSIASPFLNTNGFPSVNLNGNAAANGISDEVMERIPQQIMSLLTLNQTPRFVIYSFGQTLHPAEKSLVTGGTFNGLCTNYQITAESAVRAVVHVEGTPDDRFKDHPDPQGRTYPPHLVVEQFNVLGPD